jgi:carboxylesterase type B
LTPNAEKVSGTYYNFSNIPFTTPPLGALRFAAPVPPKTNRSVVNIGSETRICPQKLPAWITGGAHIPPDPRESEDCLYLDVVVPNHVFDGRHDTQKPKAPVMVWIYGGGYVSGDKQSQGNPAGLLSRAAAADPDGDGIIWVAISYRVRSHT